MVLGAAGGMEVLAISHPTQTTLQEDLHLPALAEGLLVAPLPVVSLAELAGSALVMVTHRSLRAPISARTASAVLRQEPLFLLKGTRPVSCPV